MSKKQSNLFNELKPEAGFNQPIKSSTFSTILLSSFFGLISGTVALLIFLVYLKTTFPLRQAGEKIINPPQESQEKEKPWRDEKMLDSFSSKVVALYKDNGASPGPITKENFIAYGLPLTSDGWIVATKPEVSLKDLGVVWNNLFYPAEKIVEDSLTNLVYLKIKAEGLPLVSFGKTEELKKREELFAFDSQGTFYPTLLLNSRFVDSSQSLHSSEVLDFFLKIEKIPAGVPVFNKKGELVALSKGNGLAVKVDFIKDAFKMILKEGKIRRPFLGVHYLDLSTSAFKTKPLLGVLLKSEKDKKAIEKNSPAAQAGLKEGDIIVAVDKFELNQNQSLAEVLAGFSPGTKVELLLQRAGEEKKVSVVLGEK
jgi:S1-C subfamily serine protease